MEKYLKFLVKILINICNNMYVKRLKSIEKYLFEVGNLYNKIYNYVFVCS